MPLLAAKGGAFASPLSPLNPPLFYEKLLCSKVESQLINDSASIYFPYLVIMAFLDKSLCKSVRRGVVYCKTNPCNSMHCDPWRWQIYWSKILDLCLIWLVQTDHSEFTRFLSCLCSGTEHGNNFRSLACWKAWAHSSVQLHFLSVWSRAISGWRIDANLGMNFSQSFSSHKKWAYLLYIGRSWCIGFKK